MAADPLIIHIPGAQQNGQKHHNSKPLKYNKSCSAYKVNVQALWWR